MEVARLSLRYFGKITLPPLTLPPLSAPATPPAPAPAVRVTVREKTHGTRSSASTPSSNVTVTTLEEAVKIWNEHIFTGHSPPFPRITAEHEEGAEICAPCTVHAEFTVKETVAFVGWVDDCSPLVMCAEPSETHKITDWGHFFMNPIVLHEVNEFLLRNRAWTFYCRYDPAELSVVVCDGVTNRELPWGARRLHMAEMVDSYRKASFKDAASAISFDGGVEALDQAELAAHEELYAKQKPARVVRKAL